MTDLTAVQQLPDRIEINGVTFSIELLVQAIATLTYPDPHKWYRFERKGDEIVVESKIETRL